MSRKVGQITPTGQWEYGETKRAGSRRIISLQNWVIARLKQTKEFQAAHPVVDPEWPEAVDLIFVTDFGRPVNVNSLVYKHFKRILRRAGLPKIRLYDLRNTAATRALTVGVSPKVVSEQLGHTSAAFTLDVYANVLPHMQDDAAAKVEAAMHWPVRVQSCRKFYLNALREASNLSANFTIDIPRTSQMPIRSMKSRRRSPVSYLLTNACLTPIDFAS